MDLAIAPQDELAPHAPLDLTTVRTPVYGRRLAELQEGTVALHPRAITVRPALAQEFAHTFHETNPLYLDDVFARAHGFSAAPASPLLILNVALSLGVQNDSEQAIAHLGYYDVVYPRPVYPGDTIRSASEVLGKRIREAGKPGVVRIRTTAWNQNAEVVCDYERAILIPDGEAGAAPPAALDTLPARPHSVSLPDAPGAFPTDETGSGTYADAFTPGAVIVHTVGRTLTREHYTWTYRLGNTHPLHFDATYAASREGTMSGEPIVYGGLVFAWLAGLASRDTTENALWDLGCTEGYHVAPVVAGDTVHAVSRVLAKEPGPAGCDVVSFQLLGVKNARPEEVVASRGAALFQKENDKPREQRIPEKIFEIERRLLVKRRP